MKWNLLGNDIIERIPERYRAEFWREATFFNAERVRPFLISVLVCIYPLLIFAVNIRNVLGLSADDGRLVLAMHLWLYGVALVFLVLLLVRPVCLPDDIMPYHVRLLRWFAVVKVASAMVFMYVIAITKGHPIFFYLATIVWVSWLVLPPKASVTIFFALCAAFWFALFLGISTVGKNSFIAEAYFASFGITSMIIISSTLLFRRSVEEFRQRKLVEEEHNTVIKLNTELAVAYEEADVLNRELKNRQDVLEEQATEIELFNTTLHEQNQTLLKLNQEKDEFLGIAAHDLKNPLNGIRGLAETLEVYDDEMEAVERKQLLGSIITSSERMFSLIKNLLDVNALEQNGMTLNPVRFDIGVVAMMIADGYRTRAAHKSITIECLLEERKNDNHNDNDDTLLTGRILVQADEQATAQVLDNLISNAVKYSPHGKRVFVRVRASDEAFVRVEIQDEGPGISAEDQQKLFGKFARLSAQPTGGEHSTGLGLSIVKKLVEAMNGRVWCESELGKGATFVVELPTIFS